MPRGDRKRFSAKVNRQSVAQPRRPRVAIVRPRLHLPVPSHRISPMSEHVTHVSDDDFESQVLQSETPVLVDFWAEWCGPCKAIAPLLDDIAQSYQGKLKIAKVNTDENQKTPRTYGIRGIPTLMIFKGGKVEATQIGAVSKGQLTQLIDKTI